MIEWASQLDAKTGDQWTYFMTMTFGPSRKQMHPTMRGSDGWKAARLWPGTLPRHHAMSAGARFLGWLSRWRRCVPTESPWQLVLWSAEEHLSGNVHIHALSVCTPEVLWWHCRECRRALSRSPNWRVLKESWWTHYGKAQVRPYDPAYRFGAERYVTKYVLGDKNLDWGIATFST